MKVFLFHIIILLMICQGLFAQKINWNIDTTGTNHLLVLKTSSQILVDNKPIENGTRIGVFFSHENELKCAGYSYWDNSKPAITITVNGKDPFVSSSVGYEQNQEFYFLVEKTQGCLIDNVITEFSTQRPNYNRFTSDGISEITSLSANSYDYSYPTYEYCEAKAFYLPEQNYPFMGKVQFSGTEGLIIDSSSGEIDLFNSKMGIHKINAQSEYCLLTTQQEFKAKYFIVEPSDIEIINANCYKDGEISINEEQFKGDGLYTYEVTSEQGNTFSYYSNDGLDLGVYSLKISDSEGCSRILENIEIINDCEKDDIFFTPGTNNEQDTYYIEKSGKAQVFDKHGSLRAEFSIPHEWDATDENGNKLPMGNYVIICNNKDAIQITIIR